jgi:hypothetical protein
MAKKKKTVAGGVFCLYFNENFFLKASTDNGFKNIRARFNHKRNCILPIPPPHPLNAI